MCGGGPCAGWADGWGRIKQLANVNEGPSPSSQPVHVSWSHQLNSDHSSGFVPMLVCLSSDVIASFFLFGVGAGGY